MSEPEPALSVTFAPIGAIHSVHQEAQETPIQPTYARDGWTEAVDEETASRRGRRQFRDGGAS
jgi:hypothetical protein